MLEGLFNPETVAVIGATPKVGKVGNTILKNLRSFKGKVYAVNPKYREVMGYECFPSIEDVPGSVDLAIVAIPAKNVPEVLEGCGRKGVKNVVVISAGFKEAGNYSLELKIVEICRRYGINLVGPNCLGIVNTENGLNATFSGVEPLKGRIALVSQSGALILALIDWARSNGIGFSKIVSLGNKAVLNENDFLEYFIEDKDTDVVILYLEGVEDGRRFMEIAKRHVKPIIAVKSGKTDAGAKAASSHTGSLAGSYEACRTAFKQCGVIEANSIEELFDYALVLSKYKSIRGDVAIVTNSGGPGVIASDAVETFGLNLARFEKETLDKLKTILPPMANVYNPVDILGDADSERFGRVLDVVERDKSVGVIVAILTPTAQIDFVKSAEFVLKVRKPVITCFMGGESVKKAVDILRGGGIPNFIDPVRAIKSLKSVYDYGRRVFDDEFLDFKVDLDYVRALIKEKAWFEVLKAYGIPVPPYGVASTADEALKIADDIGYPVAMKVVSNVMHKTDVGFVKLNVMRDEVIKTFYELVKRAEDYGAEIEGILVQKMMRKGKEVIVGMKRDPNFGPLIMFGSGGIYVEVFKDVSFRIAPISKRMAWEMVREVKAYKLLKGVRGERPSDINSVVDVILRLSKMVTEIEEILEVDMNPVFVYEKGCCAVDVKMVVA